MFITPTKGEGSVLTYSEMSGERGLIERQRPHPQVVYTDHARERQESVGHLLGYKDDDRLNDINLGI